MRRAISMLVIGATLVVSTGLRAQDWTEIGDAPEFPAGPAQAVAGCGPLRTITGRTDTGLDDFVDAYLIRVTDPAEFHATTSPALDPAAAAAWDTRLFLFDLEGGALLANDDAPGVGGSQSYLSDPGTFPGDVDPTASPLVAADYVLVITGWNNDPEDAAARDLFLITDFRALYGPDPVAGVFDHWENGHGLVFSGDYTIALAGASYVTDDTCPADIDGDGEVAFQDLLILLAAWGPCAGCPADFDCSGAVDFQDLLVLLAAWGPCPPPGP